MPVSNPNLVTLDVEGRRLIINTIAENLRGKTYQVLINYHVETDATIQPYYNTFLPAFSIQIVEELFIYAPPNEGPRVEDFLASIELEPGTEETISVGRPVDIEEDKFYVESWKLKGDLNTDELWWVQFKNETSRVSLDFYF